MIDLTSYSRSISVIRPFLIRNPKNIINAALIRNAFIILYLPGKHASIVNKFTFLCKFGLAILTSLLK